MLQPQARHDLDSFLNVFRQLEADTRCAQSHAVTIDKDRFIVGPRPPLEQ